MVGRNNGNNLRLMTVLGTAVLLLASIVAISGLQSGIVASASHGESSLDGTSGSFIINYIYEIEIENEDNPKLGFDNDTVPQGGSFIANGTNFDANSTADMSIFHEQLLSLSEDGESAERSAAVLLTKSNLTISEDGDDLIIENADNETSAASGDGSVMLVTNISPTDASADEYEISLECEDGPDGNGTSATFEDSLTVDNSTSKQFFELTLPVGEYEQCQVVMSPSDGDDPAIESSTADLTVIAESGSETSTASVNDDTDEEGSFMQNVTIASDAQEGRYVLMAETTNDTDDSVKRAVAPITIIGDDETATAAGTGDGSSTTDNGSSGTTNPPDSTEGNNGGTGGDGGNSISPPGGTDPQGPPAPPDNGGGNGGGGEEVDPCQDVVSDSGNVNNTIVQSSSQSASNTVSDDDVINVVQRIHGTYNGTGHLNTSIAIDDSDIVSQSVNQNIMQNAVIKKCPGEPGDGGNQTNTIDMNATQLASNAYSDNTTIIIVQTIIIPKDCNTNVNAPISISDRDTVTQSVDQKIDQDGTIAYGSSGAGSNTVVQTSMQVAHNNATNDEVITINQVIIVPPECPVEVQAPIVIEGNDNVQMSAVQTAEQDADINSGAGGVTIVSSIEGGSDQTTNTVVTVASQNGQNSFSDNDTITITQNVYYVNDTSGWTEENYEENLAEEFGNSTSGNSTSTEGGNSTSPISNSTSTEENGDNNLTSTEDPDSMMAAMTAAAEEENIVVEDEGNSTSSEDTSSDAGDDSTNDETLEASNPPEPVIEDAGDSGEDPPSSDNSTDTSSEESAISDPPSEQVIEEENNDDPPAEMQAIEQETPSEPVENTEEAEETTTTEPPVEETTSDPPAPEETPPADTNATDASTEPQDPEPVENHETGEQAGNSTSTA